MEKVGGGGSGGGMDNIIVPIGYEHGIEELFDAASADMNEEAAGEESVDGRGGRRGRRGRRGGVRSGRSRRGVAQTSSRFAELSGGEDATLSVQKMLTDFRVLPVGEVHVSTQTNLASRNIRSRGSLATTLKYYHKHLVNIPIIATFLHELGFEHFLGIHSVFKVDVQLCAAIALRWYKTTHTFHFPCGELGITPLDFTMLTGISVGVSAFPLLPYDDRWRDSALV